MLYSFFKAIFTFAVRTYFSEIQIRNEDNIPSDGPVILLPNHRSAFMDPLVVAVYSKRKVHFLARGESFKNAFLAKLLGKLNAIPIYRKDKTPEDMGKNEDTFEYCYRLLEKNGVLVLFPEGASQSKPILLPLKTGAARIALGAEALNEFSLNIQLVPIGINYTNPHHFQGQLFLNVGKPISLSKYAALNKENPKISVQKLTEEIEIELRNRVVIVDDSRWYDLTNQIEKIVSIAPQRFGVAENKEHANWFLARKDIAATIDYFKKEKLDVLLDIEHKVQRYTSIANLLNFNTGQSYFPNANRPWHSNPVALAVYLLLGFPVFIAGLLLNFLPYTLTNFLAKKLVQKTDFFGSIVLVLGLLIFTVNGTLLTWGMYQVCHNIVISVSFFFILLSLGLFTFRYFNKLKRGLSNLKLWIIGRNKKSLKYSLTKEMEELLTLLKSGHDEYLNILK